MITVTDTALTASPPAVSRPARKPARRVIDWNMSAPAGGLLGSPEWSGLCALLGAKRRSYVWELLLRRGIQEVEAAMHASTSELGR